VEGRLFWDRDFEMAGQFLDLPPEAAREKLDYFVAVAPDPDAAGLEAARWLWPTSPAGSGRPGGDRRVAGPFQLPVAKMAPRPRPMPPRQSAPVWRTNGTYFSDILFIISRLISARGRVSQS
jgi:hypothetical protein